MSIQREIAQIIAARYPSSFVKKIDKDNFLDIHLSEIHPGPPLRSGSTHLFFNVTRSGIAIGWYCRDSDAVSWVIERSQILERFANGIRPLHNPKFDSAISAAAAAEGLVEEIFRASRSDAEVVASVIESEGGSLGQSNLQSVDDFLASIEDTIFQERSIHSRIKEPTVLANGTAPFTLSFRAWVGEEIDYEDPVEYFSRNYASLEDAKAAFSSSSFLWDEGEWDGSLIHISFHKPPLIEFNGEVVARCEMSDPEDDEFEWIDIDVGNPTQQLPIAIIEALRSESALSEMLLRRDGLATADAVVLGAATQTLCVAAIMYFRDILQSDVSEDISINYDTIVPLIGWLGSLPDLYQKINEGVDILTERAPKAIGPDSVFDLLSATTAALQPIERQSLLEAILEAIAGSLKQNAIDLRSLSRGADSELIGAKWFSLALPIASALRVDDKRIVAGAALRHTLLS